MLRKCIVLAAIAVMIFSLCACNLAPAPTGPAHETRGKWVIVMDPETEKTFQIKYWEEKEYSPKDSSTPRIGMSIKNIRPRRLNYRDDKDFLLAVSSLDASKNVLESRGRQLLQEYDHPYLKSKEELLFTYSLFHSDETKYYRIDLRYMPSLPVEIKYIETDYARGKCELVSCEAFYSEGNEKWIITLKIKSTSKEVWDATLGVCIKDALGRILYKFPIDTPGCVGELKPGREFEDWLYIPWRVIIQNPAVAEVFVLSPRESVTPAPTPTTATKADLVKSLKDLRETMLKKIDSDIDNTAIAFTDVKDYWRSKRWADIFTAPLRILEDTLISLAKASDVKSLAIEADTTLNTSEAAYEVLTTIMMLQDLQEVGEKLHYGLDGPTYVSSVESMLEAADATYVPPFGDDWQSNYRVVIENYLYGVTKDTPLIIPRKSTTPQRKNIEFVKGALEVRSSIARMFDNLTAEIEGRELPEGFPIDEVIAQIKELERQVIKSTGYSVEVEYKTDFQDPVKTNLGAVGSLYRAFGQIAGRVAEKLEIEQRVEVLKLAETVESAALLYTISYKIPGAEEIRITQRVTTLAELSVKPYENTFYSDPEEEFYMLPQEMVLTLPGELSNLWMIADDTDQYLRHLLDGYEETQDSIDPDWYSSLVWLKDNTPEFAPDYPETVYTVMSGSDYGDWIISVAHRTPIAKPSGQGDIEASKFFTSQNESSANRMMDELSAKYVVIDYPMLIPKFSNMVTRGGKNESAFYEIYYAPMEGGKLQPMTLFYPSYYNSTIVRLYNFDGQAVVPAENATIVISYRERISREGMLYKEITTCIPFPSYKEARGFISSQETGNYRIVGVDLFKSPVPLKKLEHYHRVYVSSGQIVKIFEYTK